MTEIIPEGLAVSTQVQCGHARQTLKVLPSLVETRRAQQGLSLRDAAGEIGIPHSLLWDLENDRNVTLTTLHKVLAWMARP